MKAPAPPPHPTGRWRVLLIVPIALACLAFPFVLLFLQGDEGLIDDTRAWLGAGTAQGVPILSQVACVEQRYGSSSSRGVGLSEWSCTLYLEPPRRPAERDPPAVLTEEEAVRENDRQSAALGDLLRPGNGMPGKIERVLAGDRTGDIPALRRLSAEGEPPRFGLVWSGWELAGRWLYRALLSALFIAIGLFSLYAARGIWRRSA
jgi:hypothetical protein